MTITETDGVIRVTLSARNVEALADAIPYLDGARTLTLRKGTGDGRLLLVEVQANAAHYDENGEARNA